MSDVDLFRISEDHEALREAVRAVVQDKVAPYAASVDDESRFPQEAIASSMLWQPSTQTSVPSWSSFLATYRKPG